MLLVSTYISNRHLAWRLFAITVRFMGCGVFWCVLFCLKLNYWHEPLFVFLHTVVVLLLFSMANYLSAHPALPPLASGVEDSPAAAIALGAPLNSGDIEAASRQSKRRRSLFESSNRRATEDEVHQATKREFCIVAENAAGAVAAPQWAIVMQQQMQQQMNQMQQQMNNSQARQVNLSSTETEDPIEMLRNAANVLPPVLPATRLELYNLTGAQVATLVGFYGLQNAPLATQRRRLHRFLGVK